MAQGKDTKLAEGLKQAILGELDGHNFYLMAAEKTTDPKGQEVFGRLAAEEMDHYNFLRAHYQSIVETGAPAPAAKLGAPLELSGKSPIFSPALRGRVREAHYEMTALSVGIQLEQNAMNFYRAQAEAAGDKAIKHFYRELADWETGHYRALLRQQEELKDDYWSGGNFSPF
jgi:rubrerythrin